MNTFLVFFKKDLKDITKLHKYIYNAIWKRTHIQNIHRIPTYKKKASNPIEKWVKGFNRQLTNKFSQMAKKGIQFH